MTTKNQLSRQDCAEPVQRTSVSPKKLSQTRSAPQVEFRAGSRQEERHPEVASKKYEATLGWPRWPVGDSPYATQCRGRRVGTTSNRVFARRLGSQSAKKVSHT